MHAYTRLCLPNRSNTIQYQFPPPFPPSPCPLSPFEWHCRPTTPAAVLMFHTGSLHSLQADINRLSTKLQQSATTSKGLVTDESLKQLSAQCGRLMRNRITLRNSQPLPLAWGWMGEEPPGTTVGNLNQKISALEDALDAEKRYSIDAHSFSLRELTPSFKRRMRSSAVHTLILTG